MVDLAPRYHIIGHTFVGWPFVENKDGVLVGEWTIISAHIG